MSPDISNPTKICPTCGTRLSQNATRCTVCGAAIAVPASAPANTKQVQTPRIPEITLSLPMIIGLVLVILLIGAASTYGALKQTNRVVEPTPTMTVTVTPTITQTQPPTLTFTPQPTLTPLPPLEYKVKANDSCISIAAAFNVSPQSIITLNNLPAACNTLFIGQTLKIPQPTPTASPMPTSTLNANQATEAACEKVKYTVGANDTLGVIAAKYNVSIQSIKDYNGLTGDVIFQGDTLIIPLCARLPRTSPTATAFPPYNAPNLLLPADGASFTSINDTITLQWASVGALRKGEAYAVTIEDVTDGSGRKLVEYVTDTKFNVPASFRPAGNSPHIFRWTVLPVRQAGTGKDGKPVYEPAGAVSNQRVFSWMSSGAPVTPTP
ncbi:MAG TPA: LysM peptidoglycan-binding domain-containing protein [Anaerolineaceae bacterium]